MADGQEQQQQKDEQAPQTQALATTQQQPRRSLALHNGQVRLNTLSELQQFCQIVCYSGMVPKQYDAYEVEPRKAIGAAMVAIQHGASLGMSPLSSLQNIASVNGKPSLYGDGFWSRIIGHPECEDWKESFDEKTFTWTCSLKRKGREWKSYTFSRADAETAKLWGKAGPWTNYPKRQCQWRARGFAGRDSFADALMGVWLAEEAQDMVIDQRPEWADSNGEPVEGVHTFGKRKPAPQEETPHDANGEVKQAAPVVEQPKAEMMKGPAPTVEKFATPQKTENSGQKGLGW